VPVSFSTTAGTLSSTVATTDASGNATVQLTTNREATVTAAVGSKSGTATVTIAAQATVTLTATAGPAGTPTSVTVTPATGTAPNVVINWGDGATQSLGLVATARTVTHVYDQPGTYTVTADASEGGDTVSTSTVVTVAARPAPTLTVNPTTGTTSTNFVFTITPATAGGVRGVQIDFGDGSSQDLGPVTSVTTASHRFSSAGNYPVRVTQTDASGGTSSSVVVVSVIAGP
jgi:PKD repeat protein